MIFSSQKFDKGVIYRCFILATAILAFFGIIFLILNINYQPLYGDTVEYLRLSQTLQADSWRTLAYPLVLRLILSIPLIKPIIILYLLQILVSFASVYYFVSTLDRVIGVKRGINPRLIILSGILILFPIINHLNLTVLTDSLACSLLIIIISALIRIFILNDRSRMALLVGSFGAAGSVFIRSEKFIYLFVLFIIMLIWSLVLKKFHLVKIAVFFILLIVGFNFINQQTQKTDLGRPRLSAISSIFSRTVQGSFVRLLPKMPQVIQYRIPLKLAEQWDEDPNYSMAVEELLSDKAGEKAMTQASVVALANNFWVVMSRTAIDVIEYLAAPFNYVRESFIQKPGPNAWTSWTNTRMDGIHPMVALIYRYVSFIVIIWGLFLSFSKFRALWKEEGFRLALMFIGVSILLLSLFFALSSSLDSHIRYALPIYAIEAGVILWLAI